MKNTLYFDADFNFLLLECEADPVNTIYLDFHTTDAANQTLNITVNGGAVQTESVESDAHVYMLLDSSYWAVDGDTVIYLSNDDTMSESVKISFPEIIDASAALNKEDVGSFVLTTKQSSSGGSGDKMGVMYFINGRPYTVGTSQIKLAQITFTIGQITTALVACTLLADITGVETTALLTFRIRINRSWDEYFQPIQTVSNGKYIVTFTFPIPDCEPLDANIVEIYAYMSEGSAAIGQQQLRASVTAASLKSSEAWTGEIEVDEAYTPFVILNGLTIDALTDTAAVEQITPDEITASDTAAIIDISALNVDEYTDTPAIAFETIYEAMGADSASVIILSPLTVQTLTDSVTATTDEE